MIAILFRTSHSNTKMLWRSKVCRHLLCLRTSTLLSRSLVVCSDQAPCFVVVLVICQLTPPLTWTPNKSCVVYQEEYGLDPIHWQWPTIVKTFRVILASYESSVRCRRWLCHLPKSFAMVGLQSLSREQTLLRLRWSDCHVKLESDTLSRRSRGIRHISCAPSPQVEFLVRCRFRF